MRYFPETGMGRAVVESMTLGGYSTIELESSPGFAVTLQTVALAIIRLARNLLNIVRVKCLKNG